MTYGLTIVTGCMRSGTSLLYGLISTSPDTGPPIAPARYLADHFHIHRRYLGTDKLFVDDYVPDRDGLVAHTRKIVRSILDSAWEQSGRPPTLAIKAAELSPMLPLVAEVLPEARFVVSVRDPKDTITSILKVGERQRYFGLRIGSARANRDIGKLCKIYNAAYLPSLRAADRIAEQLFYVKYEDVVANGDAALVPVWSHCGIAPGHAARVEEESRASHFRAIADHRYWRTYLTELSGRVISRSSLGSYRQVLNPAEARRVDWRCRRVRRTFGYA
jgi:hypothetical protein